MGKLEDLQALAKMLDAGKIDRSEYDRLKADLLAEDGSASEVDPMEGRPPGWYKSPSAQENELKYWNGAEWTDDIRRPGHTGPRLTEGEIWFQYDGRIGRGQYWGRSVLFWVATFVGGFLLGSSDTSSSGPEVLAGLLILFSIWPATALAWKRLHDQGRSGAMFLLVLIPLAGPFIWLVLSLQSGSPGPNRYGPETGSRWPYGLKPSWAESEEVTSEPGQALESTIAKRSNLGPWILASVLLLVLGGLAVGATFALMANDADPVTVDSSAPIETPTTSSAPSTTTTTLRNDSRGLYLMVLNYWNVHWQSLQQTINSTIESGERSEAIVECELAKDERNSIAARIGEWRPGQLRRLAYALFGEMEDFLDACSLGNWDSVAESWELVNHYTTRFEDCYKGSC